MKYKHKEVSLNPFYYGYPVFLATTTDLSTNIHNITPLSSSFALGNKVIIGLGMQGKCFENIGNGSDMVLNIANDSLWTNIEKIAKVSNKIKISDNMQKAGYTYCDDKFALAGLTSSVASSVNTVKINECQIQAETKIESISERQGFAIVELDIQKIFVLEDLLDSNNKLITKLWKPLIFKFREYTSTTEAVGFNFRYSK